MCKHTEKENGLQDLMEIMLESLMVSEHREYLREEGHSGNKGNGYRSGRTYGRGRTLTFRTPRDRHPLPLRILAILQDQEEECDRLAETLYAKGLTQEQVGEVVQQHLHLRGTLQQGDPITDDRPPVAGTVTGEGLLPGGVHRRRAHQNPSQTERGHGSLLHDPGGEGGQDPEGAGHLQQAHRERLGLGADAGGPARAGRRQDRPHLRGRPQGAGGGHQRGLSGHEAPAVHHPPEAQHTERCPQRGQR